jgi:hypothetical protein
MTLSNQYSYLSAIVIIVCCWLAIPTAANGQFIDLQLDVDSKLTASTEQPLDFGMLTTNSGRQQIQFGAINMGIFSITALENQLLLVELNKPTTLTHDNPAIDDQVPVTLTAQYGYSSDDYQNAELLPAASSTIKVETNPEPGPWNSIYIFMYGSVDIGDIAGGIYSSEVVLTVQYM